LNVVAQTGGERMEKRLRFLVLEDIGKAERSKTRRLLPKEGIKQRVGLSPVRATT
jgi:hypothetical protein